MILWQASEEGVHFIVSRQICLPSPDILQEAPWGMDGPPPYSPVDLEQTLLVSNARAHAYTTVSMFRGALFLLFLSGANDPWRYCSASCRLQLTVTVHRDRQRAIFPVSRKTQLLERHRLLLLFSLLRKVRKRKGTVGELRSVDGGEPAKSLTVIELWMTC